MNYYNGEIAYITIDNPTLLAFKVSDKYDGGVCLIEGAEIEQIIQNLIDAQSSLEDNDFDSASAYIDMILNILQTKGVYDYCPT